MIALEATWSISLVCMESIQAFVCSMDKITAQFEARLVLKHSYLEAPKNLADCLCNKLNFLQAYFRLVSSASMHDLRHTVTEALYTVFIHLISQRRICDHGR